MADQDKGSSSASAVGALRKPKGLLEAYSEIQQYGFVERTGSPISEAFISLDTRMAFWSVGIRLALVSGLMMALITPLGIGVFKEYVPIFGSNDITIFDKFFAITIAVTFSVGYGLFLSSLGDYYVGGVTKRLIKSLMSGFAAGGIIKAGLVFLVFHLIYFKLLDPIFLATTFSHIPSISVDAKLNLIYFLVEFRNVFPLSAWFIVVTTLLTILLPIISIFFKARKVKAALERKKSYE